MRDITSRKTIREVLSEYIPRDQWLHITDIYSLFKENHKDFRPDDFLPLAEYNIQEQWKRNIRVVLRDYKLKHLIVWNGNERYLFPESGIAEKAISLSHNNGISEKELWEQLERNRIVGLQGEEYIVRYEKEYLVKLMLPKLADKVKRVSEDNVANGYDIISYTPGGKEKFIEVKTTVTSKVEFNISHNELIRAEQLSGKYYIYFLRNFKQSNSHNELTIFNYSEFKDKFLLSPSSYRVTLKGKNLE